ncbi:hypothetical protein [Pseudomonas syringae]|uniref:hypothetical protein n=1 Tax=Pseudomonas syringae TaxID=317 RepID=UPI001884009C|nr:hypothetical protein [Pseudomonas syringae]
MTGSLTLGRHSGNGDEDKTKLEPFAHAYPKYGDGGAQQIHTNSRVIYFDEVEVLPKMQ